MKNKSIARLSLRKLLLSALVAAPLATLPAPLWALPTQASVSSVSAGVTFDAQSATKLVVTATQNASVIRWTEFGSGAAPINNGDLVQFDQPSATSALLNVVNTGTTTVNGTLKSNGALYVANTNGITVGATGVIDASIVGLTTTTVNDLAFLASGTLSPATTGTTSGDISMTSGGTITAASGTGNVWLVGNDIALAGTIAGGNVQINALSTSAPVAGTVTLGQGGALTVGGTGASAVANLTVNSTGAVTLASNVTVNGPSASISTANATITTTGGVLQIGTAGANSTLTTASGTAATTLSVQPTSGNTLTVTSTGASAALTIGSANLAVAGNVSGTYSVASTGGGNVTIGNLVAGDDLTVSTAGAIFQNGTATVTDAVSLTAAAGKNVAFKGKAASIAVAGAGATRLGTVNIESTDTLALGDILATNLTATAAKDLTQVAATSVDVTGGTATLSSTGGNVTLGRPITAKDLNVTANGYITQTTLAGITVPGNITLNAGGNVWLEGIFGFARLTGTAGSAFTVNGALSSAASGTISLNAGTTLAVNNAIDAATVNLTGGNITDTGVITSSGTTTITGNTSVVLDQGHNLTNLVVTGGAANVTISDLGGVTLAKGTNATGNVSITSTGAIALGAASADTISVGKKLALNGTTITDASDNISVGEDLSITATGAVTLDGNAGTAIGLKNSYGTVVVSAAGQTVKVYEGADLKLGNITAGSLTAYSTTGITNTGAIAVGNLAVGAGTAAAPGDIVLTSSTNAITGAITLLTDLQLLGSATLGNYLAKDVSITNSGAGSFSVGANVYGSGITGSVTLAAVGAANLTVGQLLTTGPVTLSSVSGYIDASNAGNTFTTVTVNSESTSGTTSTVSSSNALTVNANITGNATGSFTFTTTGTDKNLTIGQFRSLGTGTTTFNSSGNVADSAAGLFIYGTTSVTGDNIALTSGGNFGQVWLTTTGNGNATIVESGTLNLRSVNTGSGSFAGTSQTGSIIQAGGAGTITTTGPVTLQAANGAITLNGTTNAFGNIAITAKDTSLINNTTATILGATNVTAGNLTVAQSTATNISQRADTAVVVSGTANFTTNGAGTITLANLGNQFGPVTATTGSGAIALTESGTLNLKTVTTTGNLTAISETGDVWDSGTLTVGGTAAFHAPAGNVLLDEAASNFGMVSFGNATVAVLGNVSVTDASGLAISSANVGGTFTGIAKAGDISQVAALKVFGDVTLSTLTTGATRIELNHADNQFGGVKFNVGSGGALIREATRFVLNPGTTAAGAVTIITGENFETAAGGGSTFNSDLTIQALGTIIPSSGSLLVAGTFTVISNDIVNLSALSKTANLSNKEPVHNQVPSDKYTGPTP